VTLGDVVLTTGDAAGIIGERAVSLTAGAEASILLLDLGEPPRGAATRGGSRTRVR
jgi:cytosine/adenosine deaminase-related metal-dependent hydrolase